MTEGTIENVIQRIADTFGADMERDYITVVVGVLINPDEENAEKACKEFDERLDSDTFYCPSGWITLRPYGRKPKEDEEE